MGRPADEAYLRLLPVETRAQDTPIAELKTDPTHWVHYPLNVQVPEQMAGTLEEILADQDGVPGRGHPAGALEQPGSRRSGQTAARQQVEIPKWRYAIVSFPHPLLKQGLVILDDPRGSMPWVHEPELTTSMLPAAQAVLFVLAADDGCDPQRPGDLAAPSQGLPERSPTGHAGGPQQGGPAVGQAARCRCHRHRDRLPAPTTAEALGIDEDLVFPVSAQKGLVAKIRKDDALLRRSGLPTLERQLGQPGCWRPSTRS